MIQAKNKIEALKKSGYDRIYFKGNKPYSVIWSIYTSYVYAIRVSYGNYIIVIERIN